MIPGGTRWSTKISPSWRRASASANRRASSACGPPRTGTRIRLSSDEPRCLTTAMSRGRLADDLVDGRRDDRYVAVAPVAVGAGVDLAVADARGLAAPAEDEEVGLLFGGGLDDALGGVAADAHDRVDGRAFGHEVEDLLEQPARVAGACRALGQRHALGHLHDPERRQLPGPLVHQGAAEPDELGGRARVGDGDEDPRGERRPVGHPAAFQRSTRYGLSSSNSRAWRSTWISASSVVRARVSMIRLPTRPK